MHFRHALISHVKRLTIYTMASKKLVPNLKTFYKHSLEIILAEKYFLNILI